MTHAVVYTRFSPRPDAAESESCETQEAQLLEYAASKGWTIRSMHRDEGKSGKDLERPGLAAALAELRKGDRLLVVRRDRLSRDAFLAEVLRRKVTARGAKILAIYGDPVGADDETPEGRFVRGVLDLVAQLERELIGARTRSSMRTQARKGKLVSRYAPYGWKPDPEDPARLVRDPIEQEHVQLVFELKLQGLSPWQIADRLTKRGVKNRAGGAWSHKTVSKILARKDKPG